MNTALNPFAWLGLIFAVTVFPETLRGQEPYQEVSFASLDGLQVSARLWQSSASENDVDSARPFIVLCHQAGWSRGEYQEIAPQLVSLGFDCLAIDQRSGGEVNGVINETHRRARESGKSTDFADAEQDMIAAVKWSREAGHASGPVLLWGSSYSAALALRIAGEQPDLVQGVLAFAPGEYFVRFGKPDDWIASSASKIRVPAFVTSARNEVNRWDSIFETISDDRKRRFLPETAGNHGSRALWKQFDDHAAYWDATQSFLQQFAATTELPKVKPVASILGLPSRIAFGSCCNQNKPQPVLNTVVTRNPELFIYLGDNIYGDTEDMQVLQQKYDLLGAKPEFQALRQQVSVLSIWDDHDYGANDAGKEYPRKRESREIFLDFWNVPADDPRREHEGIYGVHEFEEAGRVLQVILLDTRTFRDPLKRNPTPIPEGSGLKNSYQPDDDPARTMLGAEQWKWLQETLAKPATLRLVCSSIQFGHEYNGWESWTNLPAEQEKLVQMIRDTRANGVIFISGDVHWGEISRRDFPGLYPILDVTASGLTEDWYNVEPNRYRIGEAVRENHFGLIEINWDQINPEIQLSIVDTPNRDRIVHRIQLSDLQFPEPDRP